MRKLVYILVSAAAFTGCKQGSAHSMTKSELLKYMSILGQEKLGLLKIDCLEPQEQHRENELICFAAPYDADEFMTRVDTLKDFKDLTGWRDDYGTASKAVQYQEIPNEIGFVFTRPNDFWDMPTYKPLLENKAQGYVSIIVTDDDPKNRE